MGPATAIKLTIMPELHHFVPATAASMLAAKELAAKFPDTPEIVVASDAASVSSATVEATSAPETVPVVAHPVPESASETTETAFPQTAPAVPLSNSADEAGALPAQCPSSAEGAVSEKAQGCTTLAKSGDVPEDTGPTMEQWWAQTRPKDAADGLAQGVKTVGTSIVGSVGNVVACTISGAQQGGSVLRDMVRHTDRGALVMSPTDSARDVHKVQICFMRAHLGCASFVTSTFGT